MSNGIPDMDGFIDPVRDPDPALMPNWVIYHSPQWEMLVETGWITRTVETHRQTGVKWAHMLKSK